MIAAALLLAVTLAPRIEIVSGDNTTVTYRELVPVRVALDPATNTFHYRGCPEIRPDMEWVAPAAAVLRHFREHSCVSLLHDEYAEHTEKRAPRDPAHVAVLFLGNSLTYFNEMPRMTSEIGARESRPLRVEAVTLSGAALEDLWFRSDALKRVWQDHWDYVILQERGGSAAHNLGELFHKYLGKFADQVRVSGAQPLVFMTWYPANEAGQEALFKTAARRARARLVPIGMAWSDLLSRGDFSRLDWDEIHPNVAGSYLIACAVYATIYDKPPADVPFEFRHLAVSNEFYDAPLLAQALNAEQAGAIQRAAWKAVHRAKNP